MVAVRKVKSIPGKIKAKLPAGMNAPNVAYYKELFELYEWLNKFNFRKKKFRNIIAFSQNYYIAKSILPTKAGLRKHFKF